MKIASRIARLFLGFIFLAFGLNGFLHFIPAPPLTGAAGQFFSAMMASDYWMVIFGFQVLAGILLLANRFVPLALTILAGIIVNIVSFHIFMAPSGLPLAAVVVALWTVVAFQNRGFVSALLAARPETVSAEGVRVSNQVRVNANQ